MWRCVSRIVGRRLMLVSCVWFSFVGQGWLRWLWDWALFFLLCLWLRHVQGFRFFVSVHMLLLPAWLGCSRALYLFFFFGHNYVLSSRPWWWASFLFSCWFSLMLYPGWVCRAPGWSLTEVSGEVLSSVYLHYRFSLFTFLCTSLLNYAIIFARCFTCGDGQRIYFM